MKIKIYLDREDIKTYLEDLIDEFSEDNFEEVLANFQNYPTDYNNLVERKIKSICYNPRLYIDKDCFEIEKLSLIFIKNYNIYKIKERKW